jgi:glycosyltransferase involved in cell wall biosynthesis
MSLRKKILFLPSWYPNRTSPTLGIFVQRHAKAASLYDDVSVLAIFPDTIKERFEVEETDDEGILTVKVYYKKVESNIPLYSSLLKLSRRKQAYRIGYRIIESKKGKPDVAHVHVALPAATVVMDGLLKSIPLILTEHWTGYLPSDGRYKGSMMKRLTQHLVSKTSFILPVSEDLSKAMQSQGLKGNYRIVPNVVDTAVFHPSAIAPSNKRRIIHVSALDDEQKNVSGLLRAVHEASLQIPNIEVLIVGDGADREKLEALANVLGLLNRNVFFKGSKTPAELAELMRTSNACVLFSNYENQPCVLIEALASGLPVIATHVGGIPEYITEERGILVEPQDEKELAQAIVSLLSEEIKFDKQQLRKFAEENFSYARAGQMLHDIYLTTAKRNA